MVQLRNICEEQSCLQDSGQQCSLVVSPCASCWFPFVLVPLLPCSPKLRTEVGGVGVIDLFDVGSAETLKRSTEMDEGLGFGGGAWGCGDCVIRRHAPSCICDITAAFLSTELEQPRPLSNSSSPVPPLSHSPPSLLKRSSEFLSSVWILNQPSQMGKRVP